MAVHNAGRWLKPAVRSVLNQTFADLELLVLDNASSDGAVEDLRADVSDRRVSIERMEENLGIPLGTNRLANRASGSFIAVLDQDDEMQPEKLARQVSWLLKCPASGGVCCRTVLIDEAGSERGGDFTLPDAKEYLAFSAYSQAANFGSHLFRREVVERWPRREEFPFSSDFDFVARVAEDRKVDVIPEVLFRYRVHSGQATRRRRREQLVDEVLIRILTAKRRALRLEPWDELPSWRSRFMSGDPGEIFLEAARLCVELDLPLLAAYHARRAAGAGRPVAAVVALAPALRGAGFRVALRMFLTGPLRIHGLHPWPRR
jgi:glycosyltransferase involved in cell wall biosynthesis